MQSSVTFSISQHSTIHQPDCGLNQPQQMTKPVWECEAGLVIKPTTLKRNADVAQIPVTTKLHAIFLYSPPSI